MVRDRGRIEALDALRGFAIFGIVLINIQLFSGWSFLGTEGREALSLSEYDGQLKVWLDVLVLAKFYSLFALLFGYSFTMMASKLGNEAVRLHLRRMAGLLLFGLAHSLLLWPWDILVLYSVMGLVLTPFLQRGPWLLFTAGLLILAAGAWVQWWFDVLSGYDGFILGTKQNSVPVMANGSYAEVVAVNWELTLGVAVEWIQGMRPLRVLGLFLVGAAAATLGLAADNSERHGILWIAAAIGLLAGVPLSIAEHAGHFGMAWAATLNPLGVAVGAPVLAMGYAATMLLFWQGRHLLARASCAIFAPVGRMALTNYIGQSAICVPLFYGFGLGLFAEWSLARQMLFVLILFAAQVGFSHLWLMVFRQGPLEWLWRRMIGR
jgi:uncharacterized protein